MHAWDEQECCAASAPPLCRKYYDVSYAPSHLTQVYTGSSLSSREVATSRRCWGTRYVAVADGDQTLFAQTVVIECVSLVQCGAELGLLGHISSDRVEYCCNFIGVIKYCVKLQNCCVDWRTAHPWPTGPHGHSPVSCVWCRACQRGRSLHSEPPRCRGSGGPVFSSAGSWTPTRKP